MLGTPGSYRFDDSGMAPSSVQTTAQPAAQPQGGAQPWAGMTLGQLGLRTPLMNQFPASARPRLANLLWQRQQGNQPAAPATPATPAAPAAPAWTPAQPANTTRPGNLFSGYGY